MAKWLRSAMIITGVAVQLTGSNQLAATTAVPAPSNLALYLSMPESVQERGITDRGFHLTCVIQNQSASPLQIYKEWNSAGYYEITIEVTAVDDKPISPPIVIRKGGHAWAANFAETETITAGDVITRDVSPIDGYNWNVLAPYASGRHKLTMAAVFVNEYALPKSLDTHSDGTPIWTGTVRSAPREFAIDLYPIPLPGPL